MRENSLQVSSGALKRFYIANASNLHTLPKTIASKNFPPADAFFHWAMLLIEELPTWWGLAHPSAQFEDLWITGILHLLHLKVESAHWRVMTRVKKKRRDAGIPETQGRCKYRGWHCCTDGWIEGSISPQSHEAALRSCT